jgi:hypothetical protein
MWTDQCLGVCEHIKVCVVPPCAPVQAAAQGVRMLALRMSWCPPQEALQPPEPQHGGRAEAAAEAVVGAVVAQDPGEAQAPAQDEEGAEPGVAQVWYVGNAELRLDYEGSGGSGRGAEKAGAPRRAGKGGRGEALVQDGAGGCEVTATAGGKRARGARGRR